MNDRDKQLISGNFMGKGCGSRFNLLGHLQWRGVEIDPRLEFSRPQSTIHLNSMNYNLIIFNRRKLFLSPLFHFTMQPVPQQGLIWVAIRATSSLVLSLLSPSQFFVLFWHNIPLEMKKGYFGLFSSL